MYLDEICKNTVRWESRIGWMYLDSVGIVTVMTGRALAKPQDADSLPFQVEGRRATYAEITAEFFRVKAMEKDHLPAHYRIASSPVIADADIDAITVSMIKDRDAALQRYLRGYVIAPDAAKPLAFDMAYNLGLSGLLKYHHFCEAFAQGDWAGCAQECHREGIGDERNAWTHDGFMELAKAG